MSKEEIIGRLKNIIKIAYSKEFATFELTYQDVDAIQGLLDLYNKEKARRIKYGNILFAHNLVEDLDEFFEE